MVTAYVPFVSTAEVDWILFLSCIDKHTMEIWRKKMVHEIRFLLTQVYIYFGQQYFLS